MVSTALTVCNRTNAARRMVLRISTPGKAVFDHTRLAMRTCK